MILRTTPTKKAYRHGTPFLRSEFSSPRDIQGHTYYKNRAASPFPYTPPMRRRGKKAKVRFCLFQEIMFRAEGARGFHLLAIAKTSAPQLPRTVTKQRRPVLRKLCGHAQSADRGGRTRHERGAARGFPRAAPPSALFISLRRRQPCRHAICCGDTVRSKGRRPARRAEGAPRRRPPAPPRTR